MSDYIDPFAGPGEMCALGRETDWAATPLGPVDGWPMALRIVVRTCLGSPFPINLWCGPELVLVYNDAYRHVLGAKHPDALGRRGSDVWSEIWPEIGPLFAGIRAGGPPVYAEDAPFFTERGPSDGALPPGESNAWFTFALSAVVDEENQIVAFLNIVSESTGRLLAERAQEAALAKAEVAEARLREVFTQAPAFMAVLRGPEHVFEYVNDAYYQLVGHRELIGRPVFEALPEVRDQGFQKLLTNVMETGKPFVGRELPVILSRGLEEQSEQRYVDFIYYPLRDVDGQSSGVVAHGSDVTEHVLAREEARRARAEAEEANRAKSQFLANMSHEIRTPINAIIGYTDLLEMGIAGAVTEGQRTQLQRVRTSSQHLLMLIEDILDLAKVEAGRMDVEQERVGALQTVAAALALVGPQADKRGIRIENPCVDDTATVYIGDEDRVRQILVNLLSNAVKFTEPGGTVEVTCGTAEESEATVKASAGGPLTYLRVRDSGIGIAPDSIEAVFLPFNQVEAGHTRTRGGTGLGLTISRQLARLMGGDLTAESALGTGSTFTLWLPSEHSPVPVSTESMLEQTRETRPEHLARVGAALQEQIRSVLDRFVKRIRHDPRMPMAVDASDADLEDHASTFLADVAQSLIVLEQSHVARARLLQDGSEIQRLIAGLHGKQRAQLGWSADALVREWEILRQEIGTAVERALPSPRADIQDTLDLLERFLVSAETISHRSLRQAIGAATA